MKKIKISEKKLVLVARFVTTRRELGVAATSRGTAVGASVGQKNNIAISQTQPSKPSKQVELLYLYCFKI